MKWEQRGCFNTGERLFEVHVVAEVRQLVTDRESIPASATDIRPEHRQEIIAVMQGLAKQIHAEGQQ